MASMTPKFRKQIKELGVNGTCWTAPDGETFEVHHGGANTQFRLRHLKNLKLCWNNLKKDITNTCILKRNRKFRKNLTLWKEISNG